MPILDKARRLTTGTQRKIIAGGIVVAYLAFALSIFNSCSSRETPPPPPDVPAEVGMTEKATRWGSDFLTLWLAGNVSHQSRLDAMVQIPGGIELSRSPMSVKSISSRGPDVAERYEDGDYNWVFTYQVVGTAPGERADTTRFYSVQFIQHGVSYQATRSPVPTSKTETPFRLTPVYSNTVDTASKLGKGVADFARAYLTAGTNSSLGGTVSGDYKGSVGPLQASPYQSATVKVIYIEGNPPADDAPTNTLVDVLATVNAAVSSDAFNTVTLPLTMIMNSTGQWVVEELKLNSLSGAVNQGTGGGAAATSSAPGN